MEEELTCDICSEVYLEGTRDPVTLPFCGHTFCRRCLLLVEKSSSFQCPLCRSFHRGLPVSQMSPVYALLNLAKAIKFAEFGMCDDHSAKLEFCCQTCKIGLCVFCLLSHIKNIDVHDHDVVVITTEMKLKKPFVKYKGQKCLIEMNQSKMHLANKLQECFAKISSTCDDAMALITSRNKISETMLVKEELSRVKGITEGCDKFNKNNIPTKSAVDNGTPVNMQCDLPASSAPLPSQPNKAKRKRDESPVESEPVNNCKYGESSRTNNNGQILASTSSNTATDNGNRLSGLAMTANLKNQSLVHPIAASADVVRLSEIQRKIDAAGTYGWLKWSVSGIEGREGRLRWEEGRLHLYALSTRTQETYGSIKLPVILSLLQNNPEVFLDISANGKCIGRVYIRLQENFIQAQEFLTICVGSSGHDYKGSTCKIDERGSPREGIVIGPCTSTTRAALSVNKFQDGLEKGGRYNSYVVIKKGLVCARAWNSMYGCCFTIFTRGNQKRKCSRPIGQVISDMAVLNKAVRLGRAGNLTVVNSGLVVSSHKSKKEFLP